MIVAFIAFLGALVSGMAQSAIALNYHRQGYRPALWLRVMLGAAAIIAFLVSAGYLMVFLNLPSVELIRVYWLRPAFALVLLIIPAISLFALQQTAVHQDMLQEQAAFYARQKAIHEDILKQQIEFRQNASHELRTPLTIILGFSEMLRERGGDLSMDTAREYMGYIHHQAQNMNSLVLDLLYFDRAQAINPQTDGRPVDLTSMVANVVEMVDRSRARPSGVELTAVRLDQVTVHGLAGDLERMINNLIINAVKFSPPDRSGGTVRVWLLKAGDNAMLTVGDTGIGITPGFMPHIFQPFRQGDGSDTRQFGGVGMGLAVVKEIVRAHGGEIAVESEPGKGTTFRVYLRLHDESSSAGSVKAWT